MRFNPIAGFVLLCGGMSLAIAVYAWRRRSTIGARPFAVFMFSMTVYILGYSLELASLDVNAMLLWSKIQYVGILTFPTLYLIFTIQYSGREIWLTRRNIALLFIIPTVFLLVKFCDDGLHLIYTSAEVDTSGAIPLLSFEKGPLYMVIVAYNLLVVTAGNYFILQKRRYSSALYRRQTTIILSVAPVIYLMYGVYLTGVPLFPRLKHLDLNPFVYTLWGIAIGLAIFRHRLFDLAPIARDALIEKLSDGVVVLDAQARIVDANPEAQKIFGWRQPPVGELVDTLMNGWLDQTAFSAIDRSTKIETHQVTDGRTIYYEVTVSTLQEKRGQKIGYLIVVHDISERKEVERKLQELSLVDDLTGLANRRGFRLLANQLISMAYRMKLDAVLIYLDLDRLKWINDHLGHAVGDQALIDTGAILKDTFRASDVITRFGGDEFVILAIESTENSGEVMLARMQELLRAHNLQTGRNYELSFSIGLARYHWENPRTMDSLLEEADRVMYESKQAKKSNAGR